MQHIPDQYPTPRVSENPLTGRAEFWMPAIVRQTMVHFSIVFGPETDERLIGR